ncbi:DUF2971 domain-containing protein [Pseudophaeobacter sp.]|uniref:DUF2971 domain-containing protein n=1 Tax=Pseudophaeobacter sp. TaxID=1971739 RepID=UPI003A98853E
MYIELKRRVDRGEELEAINIYIERLMASLSSQIACACFVEDWQNIAMWNHYANGHSGACLEFTRSDELERPLIGGMVMSHYHIKLNKVKYETTPFLYDLEDILALHFDTYEHSPQNNGTSFTEFINNSFFKKSTHWAGESEWRALLNYREDISDSNWYSVFPGYCLTKVIIGPLASDDRVAKIRKLCDANNIPAFRTIAFRINYGLSLSPAHLTRNEAYRAALDSGVNEPRKG